MTNVSSGNKKTLSLYLTIFFIIQLISIFLFALIYNFLEKQENDHFHGLNGNRDVSSNSSSYLDCLYFSVTTSTTVGFGDITPISRTARIVVMIQEFCILLNLFILFYLSLQ